MAKDIQGVDSFGTYPQVRIRKSHQWMQRWSLQNTGFIALFICGRRRPRKRKSDRGEGQIDSGFVRRQWSLAWWTAESKGRLRQIDGIRIQRRYFLGKHQTQLKLLQQNLVQQQLLQQQLKQLQHFQQKQCHQLLSDAFIHWRWQV